MKPRCAIYVPKRQYREPGQCESRRAVKRIQVGDTPVLACIGHRNFIQGGGKPTIARRRR